MAAGDHGGWRDQAVGGGADGGGQPSVGKDWTAGTVAAARGRPITVCVCWHVATGGGGESMRPVCDSDCADHMAAVQVGRSAAWENLTRTLDRAGVGVIGYVSSCNSAVDVDQCAAGEQGRRPLTDVLADMRRYAELPGLGGIFFDGALFPDHHATPRRPHHIDSHTTLCCRCSTAQTLQARRPPQRT